MVAFAHLWCGFYDMVVDSCIEGRVQSGISGAVSLHVIWLLHGCNVVVMWLL